MRHEIERMCAALRKGEVFTPWRFQPGTAADAADLAELRPEAGAQAALPAGSTGVAVDTRQSNPGISGETARGSE